MELRQLAYLVAVADEASFTRAAQRLHVAQPGVSAQVRRLEEEFGEALFDRAGRRVRLTAAGEAVLPYARAALAAAAGARQAVDEIAGLVRGRVAVGMVVACSALEVPEILASFHRRYPDVEIGLTEADSDRLLESVRDGRLDLAWVGLGPTVPVDVAVEVVAEETLVAAVGPGHALAAAPCVPLEALCDLPLISLPSGTGVRSCLDAACRDRGLEARVLLEASDPRVAAHLAALGLGVAVVPASTAQGHGEGLRSVAIVRPEIRGRIALVWRAVGSRSPAARAMIAHARRVIGATRDGAGDGPGPG